MQKQNKFIVASTYKTNPYLQYFGKFTEISKYPKTIQDFNDGLVLLQIAQAIKDFRIVAEVIDCPKTFAHRLSNLKVLFKSIEVFWNQYLSIEIEGDEIDLVEIGKNSNYQQIERLMQLFIKTAAQAENKAYFIEKILITSKETQQFLKKIIEKVFRNENKQSPRKEKEKRMYDKILELDHENEKLHSVLEQICDQKLDLQIKFKLITQKLNEKTKQLQDMEYLISDDVFTPQKRRAMCIPDTSDRKDNLIQSLKRQISDMSVIHERQLQSLYSTIDNLSLKSQSYDKMKNQLILSRQIIDSHKEFRDQAQKMENEISILKAENMNKENHLNYMREKLQKLSKNLVDRQMEVTTCQGEIQRKNIQLHQLNAKLEDIAKRFSPKKGEGQHNLYLQFPEILSTQTDAYIETNRSLRQQLERTRKRLQNTQEELSKTIQQLENLKFCENQNKKLKEMVIDLNAHRGQQNEILVSSLYHMRKMMQAKAF